MGYFTIAELARLTGVTEAGLRSAIPRGSLRATRQYGRVLIAPEDAEAFARSRGLSFTKRH